MGTGKIKQMARCCMASRLAHWVLERLWCQTTEQYSQHWAVDR